MNLEQIKANAKVNEGCRSSVYTDSVGLLTCAVGFALETQGPGGPVPSTIAQHICSQLGIDYEGLCSGAVTLTDEQIGAILDIQMSTAVQNAKQLIPKLESLPDVVGNALVDMSFQLGFNRLAGFHNMLAAINAVPPNYERAASEAEASLWYQQSGQRSVRNVAALRAAA